MTTKHYFLDGNTSKGYVSLVNDVIEGIQKIYIVKGNLSSDKTKLFKQIGDFFEEKGNVVLYLHDPSNEDHLDGIITPEKSIAVIAGSGRNGIEAKYANFAEKIFDLDEAINKDLITSHKNAIAKLYEQFEQFHQEAYRLFKDGKEIHEKKEELYLTAMDFEKANKVTEQLAENIFKDVKVDVEPTLVQRLFFGAATPNGAVNYVDNITSDIKKRYIIKGRSGSGKSTLMRKIGKQAENKGLKVQYFPCGLDPHSLDMVYIPTLSVAILDGTAPHVIDPTRKTDEVVDMFQLCMDPSVDTKYEKEFEELQKAYKKEIIEGTKKLQEAKKVRNSLEAYYQAAVNPSLLSEKMKHIFSVITL